MLCQLHSAASAWRPMNYERLGPGGADCSELTEVDAPAKREVWSLRRFTEESTCGLTQPVGACGSIWVVPGWRVGAVA